MDKEYIILLKDFKFGRCGLVNQYLIDNELQDDLRVVLAEYEYDKKEPWDSKIQRRSDQCIGLEVIDEKKAFYYQLKGHKALEQKIKNYETRNG